MVRYKNGGFVREGQIVCWMQLKLDVQRFRGYLQQKMLKQQFQQLRQNTVQQLCQATAQQEAVIVQVYNIAYDKKGKLGCFLSDGNFCVKAFLKQTNIILPEKNEFSVIRIKQHVVADSGKKIGVVDFDLICEYSQLIGNPRPIDFQQLPNPEQIRPHSLELKNITNKFVNMTQEMAPSSKKPMRQEIKKEEKKQMRMPTSAPRPLSGNVKDYETIKGLFIGLKNWHLLCRLIKLDYQEFTKKNSDKLVKILNIELMDRSEVKISGVFFYQAAEKFKDQLKLNSVYKISEGSISNESYNNSKNDKMSPFRLTFGINSVFQQVSDVNIIARTQDSAITLGDLIQKQIFDQQYDVVGILVQIEEPKEITKGDKVLTRCNWVIADPIAEKRIHAVFWNDRIAADSTLVGSTLIFSRFTLHNYNGSFTLNSKIRSGVQRAAQHAFKSLEEQAMNDHKSYQLVSERKIKEEDNTQGTILKNLKDLNNAVQYMTLGQTLKTDLDMWVNRLFMKKWYYEGCPNCNKTAQKGSNCHCGKYVEQTIPHFILGLEISDHYGSIFTTAYDEQAKRIFWDEEGVIHKLMKFDQNQLKDIAQDYLYQEFKVRVYTKKDQEGRIKHNMGKLQHKIPEKIAMENVQRIKELMRDMMV